MRRLVARLARALTRRRQPDEPVCWCGIHHLGVGYVHEPPTFWHFDPDLVDARPAPDIAELAKADLSIRLHAQDRTFDRFRITYLEDR